MGESNLVAETELIPFHCSRLTGYRALVFAPHPDDESLGCGGTLIQHTTHGDAVKVIFLTDGGKGHNAHGLELADYIKVREKEALAACKVLGITDSEFFRISDRELGHKAEHYEHIRMAIAEYQPAIIYATSPQEINPDHRACAELVWKAINDLKINSRLAYYEISSPISPNTLVDISAQFDTKSKAVKCYSSQLIDINYLDLMSSLNRFRTLTTPKNVQYAEAFVILDSSEFLRQPLTHFFPKTTKTSAKRLSPTSTHSRTKSSSTNPAANESMAPDETPLVSIVVRTQNRPEHLKEALQSLADQTYPHIEIIIVNDGGVDVADIIDHFKTKLNLTLYSHTQVRGRAVAANTGLKNITGLYVGFLDDDDILYPDHISSLVLFLQTQDDLDFVYADTELGRYRYTEDGSYILISEKESPYCGMDFDRHTLYTHNYIPIMTALFTKDLLAKSGLMDENLSVLEDWDLWIRMSLHSDFIRLPQVTSEYRIFGERDYDFTGGKHFIYNKYQHLYSKQKLMTWLHQAEKQRDELLSETERLNRETDQLNGETQRLDQVIRDRSGIKGMLRHVPFVKNAFNQILRITRR